MSDGKDELVRAAERRRERQAADDAKLPAPNAKRRIARQRHRAREALAGAGWTGKLTRTVAIVVGMFGPIAIGVLWGGGSSWSIAIAALAALLGALAAATLHERALVALRLRRLRALGRGFDVDGYVRALGENRERAAVVVCLSWAEPWPAAVRASTPDAVREWMPLFPEVEWVTGKDLVLRTPELRGTVYLRGGDDAGERFFDNSAIHACLMGFVRAVLPKLEAVAPATRIEVQIEGVVEDWDAQP